MYIDEFNQLIAEIVESDEFLQMRQYKHHINGTVYDHSIQVAYLCYKYYINHNSKVNLNELLRGALLHDYFLYNRHDKSQHINRFLHVFKHPKCALKNAETIKDIIQHKNFCFHKLENKKGRNLDGYFAIDVKTIRDAWRIILQPLDENKNVYSPCNIDEIATCVKIIKIEEVSYHYE